MPVLERELRAKGYNVDLKSAAIAGQSTRQGRDWVFVEPVLSADIVLLQLGSNDANYRVLPERIKGKSRLYDHQFPAARAIGGVHGKQSYAEIRAELSRRN